VTQDAPVSGRVLTVPNVISLARLFLVPVFAWLVVEGYDAWALVVLLVSGASDWLDGVIARRMHQVTRLGQMLDPAADRLFILVTLVGLAWRDIIPTWLVVVLVLRDVVLAVMLFLLARAGYPPLRVHLAGKAGTFAIMYAFPLLMLSEWPAPVGPFAGVLGWACALWGVALYWFAGALYLTQAASVLHRDAREARRAKAS